MVANTVIIGQRQANTPDPFLTPGRSRRGHGEAL